MSHWNYRVTRQRVPEDPLGLDYVYAIRDVYYDDDGGLSWGAEPQAPHGETWAELYDDLSKMMDGALLRPGLDLDTREDFKPWRSSDPEPRGRRE